MASIFSKIVAGEIPCYKVAESDRYLAFLDVNPMTKGHTLVVPKHEVDYMMDLDEEEYTGLWAFARRVALAIKPAMQCKRVGIAVLGMEVPHCHIHLVPLTTEGDMNFRHPKLDILPDEMAAIAQAIAANVK